MLKSYLFCWKNIFLKKNIKYSYGLKKARKNKDFQDQWLELITAFCIHNLQKIPNHVLFNILFPNMKVL